MLEFISNKWQKMLDDTTCQAETQQRGNISPNQAAWLASCLGIPPWPAAEARNKMQKEELSSWKKKNILNPQLVPSVSYMHSCSKLLIANLKKDLLPGEEICLQYGTELLHILVSPLLVLFLFVWPLLALFLVIVFFLVIFLLLQLICEF